ncbi:UrcA family protein [Sphingopyxis sp. MWB1]|uniref:UrcA family protein n=1 Tax=Sphingopyxis sp. MWB1 TaxID=1537715 RepID=UPI00051A8284|nr:UrcA family protein [Sphingopyxis sp. MWB1]
MQKLSLLPFLFISAAALPAFAQVEPATERQAVSYADLDLRKDQHVRKLDRRIARTARSLCGDAPDYDLKGKNAVRACRRDAAQRARAQAAPIIAAVRRASPVRVTARD